MYYLNQELLQSRQEELTVYPLDQLDQIYQELRVQAYVSETTHFTDEFHQPDCFQSSEVFGFSQQSQVLFQSYGAPTCVQYHEKIVFIGTSQSVIICIEVLHGRIDKILAIFNGGENKGRYGSVTCMNLFEGNLFCGFSRGDVQMFEVSRKWERLTHVSRCHKGKLIAIKVVSITRGKYDNYTVTSLDDLGVLIKHNFYAVSVMDKVGVKSTQDIIYENGKCRNAPPQLQKSVSLQINQAQQSSSWWNNAKAIFKNNNDYSDNKSERSSLSFVQGLKTEASLKQSEYGEPNNARVALDLKYMPDRMCEVLDQQPNSIMAAQYCDRVDLIQINKGILNKYLDRCTILYQLKRNNLSLDQDQQECDGNLSWGEGYFAKSLQSAQLLMIRWNDVFHLVKCLSNEELVIVEGAVFRIDQSNILSANFITNNIIHVLFSDDSIAFLHTTQFQFLRQDEDNFIMTGVNRLLSKEEISPNLPQMSLQFNQAKYAYQEISDITDNQIVTLRKGRLLIQRLQTWQEFLDALIQKNQYFQALHSGMFIYQGQLKIVAGVPSSLHIRQAQMKDVFQKMAFTYVMFLLKPFDIQQFLSFEDLIKQVVIVIEFLLKTDNIHYLLTVIKDFFKDLNQMRLFFTCIQPFVMERQITIINDSFFKDYIAFYSNEPQLIAKLILQLDLQHQEITTLLQVCMEMQLYRAMIYLCNKQGDYITALIKLMSLFENKAQQEAKSNNNIEKDQFRQQKNRIGLNILAYVRMCQKGINIQGEKVPHTMFIDMLRGIIIYLFQKDNLIQFIQIDTPISLQLLYAFMHGKLLTLIKQNEQIFNVRCEQKILKSDSITVGSMIQLIYDTQIRNNYIWLFFSRLLVHNFTEEFLNQLLKQALQKDFFSKIQHKNQKIHELNVNAYLIQIASRIKCNLNCPEFPELQAYIYYQNNQIEKCLEEYLKMTNEFMRKNVFEVIEQLILSNNTEIRELTIKYSNQLVSVSQNQAYRLLKDHFQDHQEQIIQAFDGNPQNQIAYIRELIKSPVSDKIKLKYLELLCQLEPKAVLKELQNREYPLDDALQQCRKFKIIDAQAYILQKQGAIQEALEMLSTLFFAKLKDSHKTFAKLKAISDADRVEILEKLQLIMELCVHSQENDEQYEALWYQFLENFFKSYKLSQLTDIKVPSPIRELLCDIVSEVFLNMSKRVSIDIMIDKLHAHYGPIPVRTFIKTNNSMNEKFEFESSMHRLAMVIHQANFHQFLYQMVSQLNSGLQGAPECESCNDNIKNSNQAILFQCGHSYHYECYIENYAQDKDSFNSQKLKKMVHQCFTCQKKEHSIYISYSLVKQYLMQILFKKAGVEQQSRYLSCDLEPIKIYKEDKKAKRQRLIDMLRQRDNQ